jgi:glutamate dehydrogenase/leucine dehydrogenase
MSAPTMTSSREPFVRVPRSSLLMTTLAQLGVAFEHLELDKGLWAIIHQPELELIVNIPMMHDDGEIEVYKGYRVQHSSARGPCEGGMRYHPDVDLEEDRFNPAITTGKPIMLGGSQGRSEATGRYVAIASIETLRRLGRDPEHTRVAVQGFGNVRSHAANILANKFGCKIVAVSDISDAIYKADALMCQQSTSMCVTALTICWHVLVSMVKSITSPTMSCSCLTLTC